MLVRDGSMDSMLSCSATCLLDWWSEAVANFLLHWYGTLHANIKQIVCLSVIELYANSGVALPDAL